MEVLLLRHDTEVSIVFIVLAVAISAITSWQDLRTRQVPIRVLQLGVVLGLLIHVVQGSWFNALVATLVGFSVLFLPSKLSRGRLIGSGDAWVGAWMGAVLGVPLLWVALYISILLGGVVAFLLLCLGWTRKDQVPFAPILCLGMLATSIFGPIVESWIRQLFF